MTKVHGSQLVVIHIAQRNAAALQARTTKGRIFKLDPLSVCSSFPARLSSQISIVAHKTKADGRLSPTIG